MDFRGAEPVRSKIVIKNEMDQQVKEFNYWATKEVMTMRKM